MDGMRDGPAVGGPCDGARLSAPWGWNGLVGRPRNSPKTPLTYHPGRYQWDHDFYAWIWIAAEINAGTPRLVG